MKVRFFSEFQLNLSYHRRSPWKASSILSPARPPLSLEGAMEYVYSDTGGPVSEMLELALKLYDHTLVFAMRFLVGEPFALQSAVFLVW